MIQLILAISELVKRMVPELNYVDKKPGLAWTAKLLSSKYFPSLVLISMKGELRTNCHNPLAPKQKLKVEA